MLRWLPCLTPATAVQSWTCHSMLSTTAESSSSGRKSIPESQRIRKLAEVLLYNSVLPAMMKLLRKGPLIVRNIPVLLPMHFVLLCRSMRKVGVERRRKEWCTSKYRSVSIRNLLPWWSLWFWMILHFTVLQVQCAPPSDVRGAEGRQVRRTDSYNVQ